MIVQIERNGLLIADMTTLDSSLIGQNSRLIHEYVVRFVEDGKSIVLYDREGLWVTFGTRDLITGDYSAITKSMSLAARSCDSGVEYFVKIPDVMMKESGTKVVSIAIVIEGTDLNGKTIHKQVTSGFYSFEVTENISGDEYEPIEDSVTLNLTGRVTTLETQTGKVYEAATRAETAAQKAEISAAESVQTAENNLVTMQIRQSDFERDINNEQSDYEQQVNVKIEGIEQVASSAKSKADKNLLDMQAEQAKFENLIENRQQEFEDEVGEAISGINDVAQGAKQTADGIDGKATQALTQSTQAVRDVNIAKADIVKYKADTTARVDYLATQIGDKQGTTVYVGGVVAGDVRVKSDIQGQLDSIESQMATGLDAVQLEGNELAVETNGGAIDDLVVGMNSRQVVSPNLLKYQPNASAILQYPTDATRHFSFKLPQRQEIDAGIYTVEIVYINKNLSANMTGSIVLYDSQQNGLKLPEVPFVSNFGDRLFATFSISKRCYLESIYVSLLPLDVQSITVTNFQILKGSYTLDTLPPYQPYTGQPSVDNVIPIEDFGSVINLKKNSANILNPAPIETTTNGLTCVQQGDGVRVSGTVNTTKEFTLMHFANMPGSFYNKKVTLYLNSNNRPDTDYMDLYMGAPNNPNMFYSNVHNHKNKDVVITSKLKNEKIYYVFKNLTAGERVDTFIQAAVMLNDSAETLAYVPYQVEKAAISLTDTTGVTHIGRGVESVRDESISNEGKRYFQKKIEKIVFDGSDDEGWSARADNPANVVVFDIPNAGGYNYSSAISNWFGERKADYAGNYEHFYITETTMYIFIDKSRGITTVEQLRNYLATNNLVVNYKLATPILYELVATESAKLDEFLSITYSPKTYISVENQPAEGVAPIAGYLKMTDVIDEQAKRVQLSVDGETVAPATFADIVRNIATGKTVEDDIAILNNKSEFCTNNLTELAERVNSLDSEMPAILQSVTVLETTSASHESKLDTVESNISDINNALNVKADIDGTYDSMTVGNAKKATTQAISDNSTSIATTAFVHNFANANKELIWKSDGAPSTSAEINPNKFEQGALYMFLHQNGMMPTGVGAMRFAQFEPSGIHMGQIRGFSSVGSSMYTLTPSATGVIDMDLEYITARYDKPTANPNTLYFKHIVIRVTNLTISSITEEDFKCYHIYKINL